MLKNLLKLLPSAVFPHWYEEPEYKNTTEKKKKKKNSMYPILV